MAVLLGGVGPEREVSLASGRAVISALEAAGHDVQAWQLDSDAPRALDALPRDLDLVFLALHGTYGEDGGVQRALAERNFAYTGPGPEASRRAFCKATTKRLLRAAGLPLADDRLLPWPWSERDLRHVLRLAPPGWTVAKPVRLGSSVGISICRNPGQLRRALAESRRWEMPVLVEEFIPGFELTVGVIGGETLPLVEILPALGAHYDYRAKYDPQSGTRYRIEPTEVPRSVRAVARHYARVACQRLGTQELARVDFRYDPDRDRLALLEVNTIPGLTGTSLLPKAAQAAGLEFPQLCSRLCALALEVTSL